MTKYAIIRHQLAKLSDRQLADEIKDSGDWQAALLDELCTRAGLTREWIEVHCIAEPLLYKAAARLQIRID